MQKDRSFDISSKMMEDRNRYLAQLEEFRKYPTSVVSYLKTRQSRYKQYEDNRFLISYSQKRKVIQLHQKNQQSNTTQLINILLSQKIVHHQLTMIPKLDQIAIKMCLTVEPQMCNEIKYKSESAHILRNILQQDTNYLYPTEVLSLVSLTFDQPYEPLISLLIDDGIPTRPNRKVLLSSKYKYGGLASIKSTTDPQLRCTVYIFTEEVVQKKNKTLVLQQDLDHNSSSKTEQQIATRQIYQPQITQMNMKPVQTGLSRIQPQPQFQTQLQPQSQLRPQFQFQTQIQPQPQLQNQLQPQYQPQYQPQPHPQTQPQLQSQFQPQLQSQPQIQVQNQLKQGLQYENQYQSRLKSVSESKNSFNSKQPALSNGDKQFSQGQSSMQMNKKQSSHYQSSANQQSHRNFQSFKQVAPSQSILDNRPVENRNVAYSSNQQPSQISYTSFASQKP